MAQVEASPSQGSSQASAVGGVSQIWEPNSGTVSLTEIEMPSTELNSRNSGQQPRFQDLETNENNGPSERYGQDSYHYYHYHLSILITIFVTIIEDSGLKDHINCERKVLLKMRL